MSKRKLTVEQEKEIIDIFLCGERWLKKRQQPCKAKNCNNIPRTYRDGYCMGHLYGHLRSYK